MEDQSIQILAIIIDRVILLRQLRTQHIFKIIHPKNRNKRHPLAGKDRFATHMVTLNLLTY
jgi:hypothetical protein